eukprot:391805-Amphidinium_carterae.1
MSLVQKHRESLLMLQRGGGMQAKVCGLIPGWTVRNDGHAFARMPCRHGQHENAQGVEDTAYDWALIFRPSKKLPQRTPKYPSNEASSTSKAKNECEESAKPIPCRDLF